MKSSVYVSVRRPFSRLVAGFRHCRAAAVLAALLTLFVAAGSQQTQAQGTLDPMDVSVIGTTVEAIVMQPDGRIILAGQFTSVDGVTRNNIARINTNGTLDTSFNPNANGTVLCAAVQMDGKILIGGNFTALQPNGAAASTTRNRIARLNADGTLDAAFDPNATGGAIHSILLQADDKIVIGGSFNALQPNGAVSATTRHFIARLNTDGTLDNGFNPKASDIVRGTAAQPDGKIVITGDFTTLQPNGAPMSTTRNRIARLNIDGTLDNGFDPNANGGAASVALRPDGKMVVSGSFTTLQPNGAALATTRNRIAQLNSDGSLDAAFDPNANGTVSHVALLADGKLIIVGAFTTMQPNGAVTSAERHRIAQLNVDGTLTAFDSSANDVITGVAIQSDGKVIIGGAFTALQPNGAASGTARSRLARLYTTYFPQTLSAPDTTQMLWERSNTTPEISNVTFELSTNSGATWNPLGNGNRVGTTANWTLGGLSLPAIGQVRARGRVASGGQSGSSGIIEMIKIFGVEMRMYSNSNEILTGDISPSFNDNTEFGSVNYNGGTLTRSYGIYSFGSVPLQLTGSPVVAISGANAADFAVATIPASVVTDPYSLLQIKFTPSGTGLRTATVTIENTDNDENPYTFAIQGTGFSNDLSALDCSLGALIPAFSPATTSYALSVSNGVTAMTLQPTTVAPTATLYVHGVLVASGSTSQSIPLNVGANTISVSVSTPSQGNKTYTLTVTRAGSSNADLANLVPSIGTLNPLFSTGTTNYALSVGINTAFIHLTPTRSESNATVKINDVPFDFGNGGGALSLNPGDNVFTTVVTAQDGTTTKTYTLIVTRAVGTNADLSKLAPSVEFLTPVFNSATTSYSASVSYHTTSLTLSPKTAALDATLTINGSPAVSGLASSPINLGVGSNVINVVVTAGDGTTTKTYTFTVERAAQARPAGTLDSAGMASITGSYVQTAASQPDGKTIIGGYITAVNGQTRGHIARFNADGTLDTGFDPRGNSTIQSTAVLPDGRILISGGFTTLQPNGAVGATARNRIARLNSDGSLDTSFDPAPNGSVEVVVVQPDGKILIGGAFTTLQPNGAPSATARNRMARLNPDGSLDTGFNPNVLNNTVNCIAAQPDGKILIGGSFTSLQPNGAPNSTIRNRIARLNADGSLDTGFDPLAGGSVYCLTVQPDGKILAGGAFTTFRPNGALSQTTRNYLARLNADGTLDPVFNPGANQIVQGMSLQADGKVLVSGQFTTLMANGSITAVSRSRVARLNMDGSIDSSFDPNVNQTVHCIVLQPDGRVLIGGQFSALQPNGSAAPVSHAYLARLGNDAAPRSLTMPDTTQLFWQRGGAANELVQVYFDQSTDGGNQWTPLGTGTRVPSTANWQLTGLSLPSDCIIRARGRTAGGYQSGTASLEEMLLSSSQEINVAGNGIDITSGDITPSPTDHTSFGFVNISGGSLTRTFAITNAGASALNLTGTPKVVVSGPQASDFTVTVQPTSPVAAFNGTTTFQIAFDPSDLGVRNATVSIDNNDSNESPFTFSIQGSSFSPDLLSLVPSVGSLTPAFSSTVTSYTTSVDLATTTIQVTPTKLDPAAIIKVNNVTVASGAASGTINLSPGANTITTVVTAQDASTKTYLLTVNRTSNPTNADLVNLASSAGPFTPGFEPTITSYTQVVSSAVPSITVTPTKSESTASIAVNGVAVASGNTSGPINLPLASNLITIVVTAADGVTTKTYTLTVLKPSLAFTDPVFIVNSSASASTVDIIMSRQGGAIGEATCTLTTSNGTAAAPDQYTAQTGTPITFPDTESVQHLLIPIAANATTTTAKTFTISLSNPVGVELDAPSTATVVILPPSAATDNGKPAVTITTPTVNENLNDVPAIAIQGTATDTIGVRRVQVSTDNGGTFSDAALSALGTPSTGYTFTMTPVTGLNTVLVKSIDFKGNVSTVVSRSFIQLRTLAVTVSGDGAVTTGFTPSSYRQAGKTLALTATPKPGAVFNGWTANNLSGTGITAASAELPSLSFTMQTGLQLTAHFIANPFTSDIVGTYTGLVTPAGATPVGNETVGFLSNAKVLANGTFTSTLKIDGLSKPVNGVFDSTGTARFGKPRAKTLTIARNGKPALDVALQLDMTGVTRKIIGSVTQRDRGALTATSTIDAGRAHYSATSKVPTPLAGLRTKPYTLVFPAKLPAGQPTGITVPYYPQGNGYATMTVNVNGTVAISGKLADHTPFTASAPLNKDSKWPLFAQLYAGKGCFAGVATLTDADDATHDITGTNLRWIRPYQDAQWYPYGWDDGIYVDAFGARYVVLPATSVFPALPPGAPNASLQFFDGMLPAPLNQDVAISSANVVTSVASPVAATMTITKATGLIAGGFHHTSMSKVAYQGVIVQKGAAKGGWGYFMTPKPKVLDYLGCGGEVQVVAKP